MGTIWVSRGPICSTKKLVGHNLSGPICRGQICQGSICRGLICRGPICRKKLLRPNLPPTKFPGPNFPHSKFPGPNLSQQNFQGAQFAATKFPRGPICRQGAQSARARFAGAQFAAKGPNLPGPDLTKNGKLGPKKCGAQFAAKSARGPICLEPSFFYDYQVKVLTLLVMPHICPFFPFQVSK